ncbi:phosphoribosylformylglycinamidine synthase subunit PurS [Bdellovibrionota bacterium]
MIAEVFVTLKEGVLDPQGKAVASGLQALGFADVKDVRVGKYITVALDGVSKAEAEERAEEMCQKLLANTVIEKFRYTIREE